ncbi:substrate-binding domain-containing protein [Plectonema cf. radiosum LEGE 06105]|uniref:Substrate-binding domain-containing protein n=1 Tax=Plectonema cf. radiosum LEGE 06105 TaxID=945769 RepID=A0A8J7EXX0_9CYAN|nr:substrate-binding domain-containing protein [Plectonema radiosum]MBE9211828.1 substrate-binding domain-containing protein [Plectonema cf. radiosum LEGE 06105]
MNNKRQSQQKNRTIVSLGIILASLGLAYAPVPGLQQTVVIVSGSELQEPLKQLEVQFERENPNIKLELKFQGSQEIVNKFIDNENDFTPTILIPANGEKLTELSTRYQASNSDEPFYEKPLPIAKTMLVGIAWQERGKVLFPDGRFRWDRVEKAMQSVKWSGIGGASDWGSFDFVTTNPTRSNSGQLTMSLWTQSKVGGNLNSSSFNNSAVESLFGLVKRSVYQPPRSTDILLEEFIAKGANDADVATVYESIALHRWEQATKTQGKPYQIYYLNPTIETISTAAIVKRNVDQGTANAGQKFLNFLTQPQQQAIFVQYGFRPANNSVDLKTVPNSPWNQNIPGAEIIPTGDKLPPPNTDIFGEIQRLWERVN